MDDPARDTDENPFDADHRLDGVDGPNPTWREAAAAQERAIREIEARGESPERILKAFDDLDRSMRARIKPTAGTVAADSAKSESRRQSRAPIYFEEPVAAGPPVPSFPAGGRSAELADSMPGIDPAGKTLVELLTDLKPGSGARRGDALLVDSASERRDGDLLLATSEHGQIVGRLRVAPDGAAFLDSQTAGLDRVELAGSSDPRILGIVVRRCGFLPEA